MCEQPLVVLSVRWARISRPPGTRPSETAIDPGRTARSTPRRTIRAGRLRWRRMRVVYIAAGAGGMYCGSCLRDNRLAAALLAAGRDIALIPTYTPLRTDTPNVSRDRVYYGGVNVFLQQHSAVCRHLPRWLNRLLDAPALLRAAGRLAGATTPNATLGALTVSILAGEHGRQRVELRKLVVALRNLAPDVVNLPNLMFLGLAPAIRDALGAPVVCTLSGEDVFLDALPEPYRRRAFALIRQHATVADGFIALTRYYAAHAAAHFELPRDRIDVVPLGVPIHDAPTPGPATAAAPFTIGYLARICHEKGLHILADAVLRLRRAGRNCRVDVAGYVGRHDRRYLDDITAQVDAGALRYEGEVDIMGKRTFLSRLDVLSVPTAYPESKGLYVLEALAAGVPVVQPRHGSFPELVDATGGGLLCAPNDPADLADTLARLMDDEPLRRRLADAGQAAVHERFTDTIMAERTWALYERYHDRPRMP